MTRKQFLAILAVLLIVAAAGAGVLWSNRTAWQRGDARLGDKLLPGLKAAEVSEIVLRSSQSEVHIRKSGEEWKVLERGEFPADPNAVSGLLHRLIDLKVVQIETLNDGQRARLHLIEPGGRVAAEDAEKAKVQIADGKTAAGGTILELKGGSGKVLGRLLLGKTILKPSETSGESDIPAGRYVLFGESAMGIAVVADPLKDADPGPAFWLDKDIFRADSVKTVTAAGPDGKQRWSLTRAKEGDLMSFVGSSDKPDPQKGQDTISTFYGVSLIDVVSRPAAAEAGLEKPLTVTAQSFDGITYVLKIGSKAGDDRYYLAFSSSGDPSKFRVVTPGESTEDKAKKDKEFEEQLKGRLERRARDRLMERWTYIVPKTAIAAVLRDRAELMPDKKK